MLAFLDESGDAGVNARPGSSRYFVLTVVLFNDHDEATLADKQIAMLRRDLGLAKEFEFKFNKLNRHLRSQFLTRLVEADFQYLAVAIDKEKLSSRQELQESLYRRALELLFGLTMSSLSKATVIIDGEAEREFRRALSAFLRQQIGEPGAIHRLKLQDSRSNNLIQLADMVSGSVLRTCQTRQTRPPTRGQSRNASLGS